MSLFIYSMNVFQVAIVENEEVMIQALLDLCQRYEREKDVLIKATSFHNGYDFLESDLSRFDAVFMDIDMPGINGMDTSIKLREKNKKINIVFVTNLPQYAISGYKVSALDFILKPITYPDFYMVMDKIKSLLDSKDHGFFLVNVRGTTMKFYSDEVEYIEMIKHDVVIHKSDRTTVSFRGSLKALEKDLNPAIFYKCNSGYIVNLFKVVSFDTESLVMESKANLLVSRSHKKEILDRMNSFYQSREIEEK